MALRVGILSQTRVTVHFIATSSHISLLGGSKNSYWLECRCGHGSQLPKNDMRPYLVSNEVFATGIAREGEYRNSSAYRAKKKLRAKVAQRCYRTVVNQRLALKNSRHGPRALSGFFNH